MVQTEEGGDAGLNMKLSTVCGKCRKTNPFAPPCRQGHIRGNHTLTEESEKQAGQSMSKQNLAWDGRRVQTASLDLRRLLNKNSHTIPSKERRSVEVNMTSQPFPNSG